MEEQQVWNMGLDEGMLVWVGKDGQIRGRCKRMDISRMVREKYQVRVLAQSQDVGAIYDSPGRTICIMNIVPRM